MEGIILEPEVFANIEAWVGAIFGLLAVAGAGIALCYLEDEDRNGRRHYWMEEPLATGGETSFEEELDLAA